MDHVAELPANEQPPSRRSSIFKKPRVSNYEGYSDGLDEYMTLAGYVRPKRSSDSIKHDPEKVPRVLEDGLIPTESEKRIDIPSGLQYIEPAQGLEPVHDAYLGYSRSFDNLHEIAPSPISKYPSRPPTRSKTQPLQLAPLHEDAELDAGTQILHSQTQPKSYPSTIAPPQHPDSILARDFLEALVLDIPQHPPRKAPTTPGSIKSSKSVKSKFPLIPRRSISKLFRRESERKKDIWSPAKLALSLQHAAHSGNISLVASLVTLGAKVLPVPDHPTRYRDALSCAAVDGHQNVVDYLINAKCGADQDSIDAAFLECCYASQVDIAIRLVRNHGASLETRKMAEWEKVVQDMPEEEKKLIVGDRSCYHALSIMPNSKERERLLTFLTNCDDFNKDQVVHHTFVVSRVFNSPHIDSSKDQLFTYKNQRFAVHCFKYTAISLFTSFNFIDGVLRLLEFGVKTKYSSTEKKNLASLSQPESILAAFPADATTTPDPISCISDNNYLNCSRYAVELLGLLICNGADPHVVECTENDMLRTLTSYTLTTPLFRAIAGRNLSAIHVLLGVGVKQDTDDCVAVGRSFDVTPLGLAVDLDDVEIVKALLENSWKADWIVAWSPMKGNGSRQVHNSRELARKRDRKHVLTFFKKFHNNLEDHEDDEAFADIQAYRRTISSFSDTSSDLASTNGYSYYGT